tara:strand:+ start:1041 stop:1493 length:453 start_codon:yes stop_codon:yes gene_type:complete
MNSKIIHAETLTLEIDNPRFTEKGLDKKIYEIRAKKGLQSDTYLELIEVEGKFKTDEGVWIFMTAGNGKFFRSEKIIKLADSINFYTDGDETIKSDLAIFDVDNGIISFEDNVEYIKNENKILADRSVISNNFNNILYEGNVKTRLITKN